MRIDGEIYKKIEIERMRENEKEEKRNQWA